MRNLENAKVSYFNNKTEVIPTSTKTFKELCASSDFKEPIELLRSFKKGSKEHTQIKASLPCFTPSGIFSERKASGILEHSGYISIDIDNIENTEEVKQKLKACEFVALASLSCSGNGLYALIPIEKPNLHKQYYKAIVEYFKELGITLDKSCSDISRLRFVSFDPNCYSTFNAKVWNMLPPHKPIVYEKLRQKSNNIDENAIYAVLNYVNSCGADITSGRSNWLKIGSFIYCTLGSAGKSVFVEMSQYHPRFNQKECERIFEQDSPNYKVNIGAFLNVCKNSGIPKITELLGLKILLR